MNRRRFLQISILGSSTLGGCLQGERKDEDIASKSFNITEDSVFNCLENSAIIEFHRDENKIIVNGQIESGGRSCTKTVLESPTFSKENGMLKIVVADKSTGGSSCSAEEGAVPYRASVVLKQDSLQKVNIIHKDKQGNVHFDRTVNMTATDSEKVVTKKIKCE
ncbi:hypothetical protein [Haladaptatus salinisoli]|uniref:hypothetical protein n=1 Tax=Haladaptatus salinisoli TaxID=2884876 RepID=UPI001D09DC03|nr:hypothetical protein [Haladaptatus salinisoli]